MRRWLLDRGGSTKPDCSPYRALGPAAGSRSFMLPA
jgi:hypothetical protein